MFFRADNETLNFELIYFNNKNQILLVRGKAHKTDVFPHEACPICYPEIRKFILTHDKKSNYGKDNETRLPFDDLYIELDSMNTFINITPEII